MIAIAAFLAGTVSSAAGAPPPTVTFDLSASEVEIDEGDIVDFDVMNKEYRNPATGEILKFEADLSPVKWDFGDRRCDPAEAYGLYHIRHWFSNDAAEPFVVTATHQGTTKEVAITVRNVLPSINGVYMTEHPQPGKPTVFKAIGRDPGFSDALTYNWKFGDGSGASGQNVIHTYASGGPYQVTLSVADEEGREHPEKAQGGTFTVTVSNDRDIPAVNTISVSGDVSETRAEIVGVTIVGSKGNPMNPEAGGPCQIRLEMRTDRDDMLITLTARLDPGLAPGSYTIGNATEWDGMHRDDRAAQGTFFADFSPPKGQADRNIDGLAIGGPFWSDRGRIFISRFDSGVLELNFEADLTENIPAVYGPRQVSVRGALATTVGGTPKFDGSGGGDLKPGTAAGDMFSSSEQDGVKIDAYFCAGEEPAEFEVVGSNPGANVINAKYQDSAVDVRFSQVVDSDSIVNAETLLDNLNIYVRSTGDAEYTPPGGWVVSPKNPKVVQFIPQSRLLPGAVYCVYVNGGEDGVRSLSGHILSGSSLDAPSAAMARACEPAGENRVGFTFSTRVELESAWVDLYQASLAGPHAELLANHLVAARVYIWWQNAWRDIHPAAEVRAFPANVFISPDWVVAPNYLNSALSESVVSMTIKRPDLYTDEEKRFGLNTPYFFQNVSSGTTETVAGVQMKTKEGQPIDPVFYGARSRVGTRIPPDQNFTIQEMRVEGVCEDGLSAEECGWGGPWDESLTELAAKAHSRWESALGDVLPADAVNVIDGNVHRFGTTRTCPGGFSDGFCYAENREGESVESMRIDSDSLAKEIHKPISTDIVVALVPPGLLQDPVDEPIEVVGYKFPYPSVIFVQIDRYNEAALARQIVRTILGDEACLFDGSSFCDHTPVQSGAADNDRLNPLLKSAPYDDYSNNDFHISAYNYGKLYEALRRKYDYVHAHSNDVLKPGARESDGASKIE